ncbi:hypothetical protein N9195_00630 [bacterium]|nr:hypothetical protein [bacterium]
MIYSTDLIDWDNNLNDEILADAGKTTTQNFDITGLAGPNGQLFVRVFRQ